MQKDEALKFQSAESPYNGTNPGEEIFMPLRKYVKH